MVATASLLASARSPAPAGPEFWKPEANRATTSEGATHGSLGRLSRCRIGRQADAERGSYRTLHADPAPTARRYEARSLTLAMPIATITRRHRAAIAATSRAAPVAPASQNTLHGAAVDPRHPANNTRALAARRSR